MRADADQIERISVSLPGNLLRAFDAMVQRRGYANRSQAVGELLSREINDLEQEDGDRVMTGTITIVYRNDRENLQGKLAAIQRRHVSEVISSLHVHLENDHTLEVLLVQGPASILRAIADELVTCKGVRSGKLSLSSIVMPPLHPRKNGGTPPTPTPL